MWCSKIIINDSAAPFLRCSSAGVKLHVVPWQDVEGAISSGIIANFVGGLLKVAISAFPTDFRENFRFLPSL